MNGTETVQNGVAAPAAVAVVNEILTPAEAAAYLRVDEAVVLAEAVAGRLPGRCIAGAWRFAQAGLHAWVMAGQPQAAGAGPLSAIGSFADDDTLEPMVVDIYRERKRRPVGG